MFYFSYLFLTLTKINFFHCVVRRKSLFLLLFACFSPIWIANWFGNVSWNVSFFLLYCYTSTVFICVDPFVLYFIPFFVSFRANMTLALINFKNHNFIINPNIQQCKLPNFSFFFCNLTINKLINFTKYCQIYSHSSTLSRKYWNLLQCAV